MTKTISNITFTEPLTTEHQSVLSNDAIEFLNELTTAFAPKLETLLEQRKAYQEEMDNGNLPHFLPETQHIREDSWRVRDIPSDLLDRRVEITGPVDRKMIINALNSDARVFMADFEDSLSPTWENIVQGHINMRDANERTIAFHDPKRNKDYALNEKTALLIARVRGLHLPEKHALYTTGSDELKPIPGSLFDFAIYFFNNYQTRISNGTGVYLYVPKIQSYLEAQWWSEIFHYTEKRFKLPTGTIRATYLIETLPAVFQMHEILYSLKDHIVALNCGRWDYIFSYIKTLRKHKDRVLPDRQSVTMSKPFLNAYSRLLIQTCHKRGALAMGGMAAFIPAKDPAANEVVAKKVFADKEFEAKNGHDGTWIAHPGLANIAFKVFDEHIDEDKPNQQHILHESVNITESDLLEVPEGERTEEGMRLNIRVSLQYLEAWISGLGCVPIYGLMEDAATVEISRASIWQWIHHEMYLSNGKKVTKELFRQLLDEEIINLKTEVGEDRFAKGKFEEARTLMDDLTTSDELADFLTLPAYQSL